LLDFCWGNFTVAVTISTPKSYFYYVPFFVKARITALQRWIQGVGTYLLKLAKTQIIHNMS